LRTSVVVVRGNPFVYQRPLAGQGRLIDRHGELDSLQHAAADQVAIRLASPRRSSAGRRCCTRTMLLAHHLFNCVEKRPPATKWPATRSTMPCAS